MSSRKSFDNDTLVSIGHRIAQARGERTQDMFAKAIGVSRSALANYESGRRLPNNDTFQRIEKETGVPRQVLLFGDRPSDHASQMLELKARIISIKEKQDPGALQRFMISDDEMDIIKALREVEEPAVVLTAIADAAEASIEMVRKSKFSAPKYAEQFVTKVRRLARSGYFQSGFDPDRVDWQTLLDEIDFGIR